MPDRHGPDYASEVLANYLGTDLAPSAIMSFNAEPLLPALLNANLRVDILTHNQAKNSFRQQIDLITHSITNRNKLRVPYYFIHGLLPVPSKVKKRRIIDSIDKLVFSESTYLQLANTSFSWQSAIFMEVCSSKSVVFVGVSLSDPNMRRWLSWIHMNRMNELGDRYSFRGSSTSHYWILRHPGSGDERAWIESIVEHLGIRLIWIEEWSQLGKAFRSMLSADAD